VSKTVRMHGGVLLALLAGCGIAAGQCGEWTLASPGGPPPRGAPGVAYDPIRGVTVLYGGSLSQFPWGLDDTWHWDGTQWLLMAGGQPEARRNHAMFFDPFRGTVVMFGGTGAAGGLTDTWEWDGSQWSHLPGPPAPNCSPHAAYDTSVSRAIVYCNARTWEWDSASAAWSEVQTVSPPWRLAHQIAYDQQRERSVVYGGSVVQGGGGLGGTWEYDSAARQWTQVATSQHPTSGLLGPMGYDPVRQRVLLLNRTASGVLELWAYDGAAGRWDLISTSTPPLRHLGRMVHDSVNGDMLMVAPAVCGVSCITTSEIWRITAGLSTGPAIQAMPQPVTVSPGSMAQLSVEAMAQSGSLTYQWYREGQPLADGGAFSGTATATLTVSPALFSNGGRFHVVVSDGCGSTRSREALLGVHCYADCSGDMRLNIDDFTCFINEYAAAPSLPSAQVTSYANCDGSTTPPVLNVDDFMCFINGFAAGCP
jgi:hypothetical protein